MYNARIFKIPSHSLIWRRGQSTWKEEKVLIYAAMSSSSEDEEAAKESSSPSEWWEDSDERSTDQEESGQDEDVERYGHDTGGSTRVASRGKQDLKRRSRRKREDRTSSDQEETDQDEDRRHDRREPTKVASRGKQERRRKGKREHEGRTSSDEEETDQGSTSLDNLEKIEQSREVTLGDREQERRGTRKKLRGGESSESVAGIIYLSRVPPFMKPHKVKHLLSRYGSVGRVYLKPEGQFSSAESFPEIPCGSGTRLS